jgi:hypothetical protein
MMINLSVLILFLWLTGIGNDASRTTDVGSIFNIAIASDET